MAANVPAEITRAWFERVWNQGDESVIDQLFAPTGIAHGLAADGVIKGWNCFDFLGLYQQLGLIPKLATG